MCHKQREKKQHTREIDLADNKSELQQDCHIPFKHTAQPAWLQTQTCVLLMTLDGKSGWLKTELTTIMDDLTDHMTNGDCTIISGVSKFMKGYINNH